MLVVVDFDYFRDQPARAALARPRRRRVLRRADRGVRRRTLAGPALQAARLDHRRPVRAGHRARPRHRPARLPAGGLLLRTPDRRAVGASRSPIRSAAANVGTPLGIPLHPTQLYDAGAELLILIVPARSPNDAARRSPAARSGSTCSSTPCRGSSSRSTAAIDRGIMLGFSTSQFVSLLAGAGRDRHAAAAASAPAAARLTCRDAWPRERRRALTARRPRRRRRQRLDRLRRAPPAGALALAGPAADRGRPRHARRTAGEAGACASWRAWSWTSRSRAGRGHAGSRKTAARRSCTTTRTSSSINKPAGHGRASRRRATPTGTLVNALLHHVDGLSAASAAPSGRASCIGSIAARRA